MKKYVNGPENLVDFVNRFLEICNEGFIKTHNILSSPYSIPKTFSPTVTSENPAPK